MQYPSLEFVKNIFPDKTIITFSDNRLHDGSMYKKLGFRKVYETKPDYEYTDGDNRYLVFSRSKKTVEARDKGFYRIRDSGKTKWVLEPSQKV